MLEALPGGVRDVIAELDRAASIRAQRLWIGGLLRTRAVAPYRPARADGSQEESRARGDLSVAAERLEAVLAGTEQAALALDDDAQWNLDPRWMTKPAKEDTPAA